MQNRNEYHFLLLKRTVSKNYETVLSNYLM